MSKTQLKSTYHTPNQKDFKQGRKKPVDVSTEMTEILALSKVLRSKS
jgi:hypothetical protein